MNSELLSYQCPFCDHEVRVGQDCPGCEKKLHRKSKRMRPGKSFIPDHSADGLGLSDDDFDYDDFVAREFGTAPHRKTGLKWYWWLLGVVVLTGMIAGIVW